MAMAMAFLGSGLFAPIPSVPCLPSSRDAALIRRSSSASRLPRRCSAVPPTRMGLRIVRTYDSSFELKPECQDQLHKLLSSPTFCAQVGEQFSQKTEDSIGYEFTGELFQPVPWSVTTPHGMPQEFEKYFNNPDYVIVNVPPNFMFRAKIFNPSRLCAVFKKVVENDVSAV